MQSFSGGPTLLNEILVLFVHIGTAAFFSLCLSYYDRKGCIFVCSNYFVTKGFGIKWSWFLDSMALLVVRHTKQRDVQKMPCRISKILVYRTNSDLSSFCSWPVTQSVWHVSSAVKISGLIHVRDEALLTWYRASKACHHCNSTGHSLDSTYCCVPLFSNGVTHSDAL